MRRTLALALACGALWASVLPFESEARDRRCRPARNGARTDDCVSYAFFEAFPTSGAGTTSACDTTAPTGAKGEQLTFSRASTAYCTKTASGGLATTGIADGDLVSLSNNVARVEYDGAGTLGLRVEPARTNSTLQSQSFDSPTWSKTASGVAIPTVTANAATAPDGTTTAERVQIPATTTTQYSFVSQGSACPATSTGSIYIRGNGTSGTIEMWFGSPGACLSCSYVSGSWSRCFKSGNVAGFFVIGNDGANCGSGTRSAQDVFIWQAQCETGTYASSPILTTTATAQRVAESPYFTIPSSTIGSFAASASMPDAYVALVTRPVGIAYADANNRFDPVVASISKPTNINFSQVIGGSTKLITSPATFNANITNRVAVYVDGSTAGVIVNGSETTSSSGVLGPLTNVTRYYVGAWSAAGYESGGVVTRACLDPDPTRCR